MQAPVACFCRHFLPSMPRNPPPRQAKSELAAKVQAEAFGPIEGWLAKHADAAAKQKLVNKAWDDQEGLKKKVRRGAGGGGRASFGVAQDGQPAVVQYNCLCRRRRCVPVARRATSPPPQPLPPASVAGVPEGAGGVAQAQGRRRQGGGQGR